MVTYKLHLIRHGLTDSNLEGRYAGQNDEPLCDRGERELLELKQKYIYPEVELVCASPLARCVQTAGILYPDKPLVVVEDMREMNFGAFEGKTADELQEDPDFLRWLENSYENAPPDGESGRELLDRVSLALGQVFRLMMEEKTHNVALVTHGGVIAMLLSAFGFPREPLDRWLVLHGEGYSITMNAQMWMRDGIFEVTGILPLDPEGGEPDTDGWDDDEDLDHLNYED